MVYLEPSALGLGPLLSSWLNTLPPGVSEHADILRRMCNELIPTAIKFVRRNLKETLATVDHNLIMSCFNIFDSMIKPYRRVEGEEPLTADEKESLEEVLPPCLLFSIIWSIGASCDMAGRPQFDNFLRGEVTRYIPDRGRNTACFVVGYVKD